MLAEILELVVEFENDIEKEVYIDNDIDLVLSIAEERLVDLDIITNIIKIVEF